MGMGLSLGSASHALGTVRSMQLGGRYVAYATLGLILNGIMTAFFSTSTGTLAGIMMTVTLVTLAGGR